MKTIAIPLLLASSAKAAGLKNPSMDKDHAVKAPILIASAVLPVCLDAGNKVSDAQTALANLKTAATPLESDHAAAVAAAATAQETVATKIAAVNSLHATHAATIATDDAALEEKINADRIWNEKTYEEIVALAAKTAANNAVTVQTTAQTAQTALVAAYSEASAEALSHWNAEVAAKATSVSDIGVLDQAKVALIVLRDATAVASPSGILGTVASTAAAWKVKTDALASTLQLKTDWTAKKTEADIIATTLGKGILTNESGSAAKARAEFIADDNADAVDWFTLTGLVTSKEGAWATLAQDTVAKLTTWNGWKALEDADDASGYVSGGSNQLCSNASSSTANSAASIALCKTACNALLSWPLTNSIPAGAIATTNTHCYGFEWIDVQATGSQCKLMFAKPTASVGASNDLCDTRAKTTAAEAVITAVDLSKDAGTAYQEIVSARNNAAAKRLELLVLDRALDVATKINTDWIAVVGTGSGNTSTGVIKSLYDATANYDTAVLAANTASGNEVAEYNAWVAALKAQTDNITAISDKEAEIVAANTADGLLQIEVDAQLVTKDLAASEYSTANAAMLALQSNGAYTSTAINTASSEADAAYLAATQATASALVTQGLKDTAVSSSTSAAAAGRAALVAARAETTSAYVELGTKNGDVASALLALNNQKGLIAAKEAELQGEIAVCEATKFDEYAAALVTAQETRESKLASIERLIETAETNKPTLGAAGWRCEKAISFGTFRPARGEATCAENLCCGAARIPLPGQSTTTMTVETCQPLATTEFSWTPPRAAMATTAGDVIAAPFACIDGARKLAAAASALAAAVYMLA